MAVTHIKNSTDFTIILWDDQNMAAELPAGRADEALPTAITRVTLNGFSLRNKLGDFMDGDGYLATTLFPGGLRFTGETGVVDFW